MEFLENKKIQVIVLVVILSFSLWKTINIKDKNQKLFNIGDTTIGVIVDHTVIGYAETYYVGYVYKVAGIEYSKSINYSFDFITCHRTRDCIGRRFTVYYNPDDPKEAYIDFDDEK